MYLDCFAPLPMTSFVNSSISACLKKAFFLWGLAMTCYKYRHCERRAWDKSPAKKSDDNTDPRHCERSEAIQQNTAQSGLLRASQ